MTEQRAYPLRFEPDPASGRLVARLDPSPEAVALDVDGVQAALARDGFGDWRCLDDGIVRLCGLAGVATEPVAVEVAERVDGRFELAIAEDAMTVWLTVVAPAGGAAVRHDDVLRSLAEQGVASGIDAAAIDRGLAEAGERRVIARGRAPEPGRPAQFHGLVPDLRRRGPRVDERGLADYRELGTVLMVKAGDPLMRRVPATPGVEGMDVFGRPLPSEPGADIAFADDLAGAAPAADDADLLVATRPGQPVQVKLGVRVEPTISLPVVDLVSGNIDFDGTVTVAGDVAPGMQVRATGDVIVGGTVEAAEIVAGGDISVVAGAIGHAEQRVRLLAQGSVSTRFCENAVVEAGGDVLVADLVVHSELTALQRIVIGKAESGKSQLIGGMARAGELLQVGTLGSVAAVRTRVQVGYQPQIHARVAQLRHDSDALETRLDNLRKVLALPELPGRDRHDLRAKAELTLSVALAEQAVLAEELAEQEARLELIDDARIVVGQTLHPAVEIQLGGRGWTSFETMGKGVLRLAEGELVYRPE